MSNASDRDDRRSRQIKDASDARKRFDGIAKKWGAVRVDYGRDADKTPSAKNSPWGRNR